jgi:hypothetical protein
MDTKIIKATFTSMLLCSSCHAYDFNNASELTLFKNYALSACVASNYGKGLIYQDAIDALNGNREYGNISLDAYYEINDTLKKWSKKKYISKAGNVSEFFMCIDFQNSKDVLETYKKYNPCKNKENWSSEKEFELRCKNA